MIIRTNTVLINEKLDSLGVEHSEIKCPIFINTDSIESIRPFLNEEGEMTKDTIVIFCSGDEHILDIDFKELVKIVYLDNGIKIKVLDANC